MFYWQDIRYALRLLARQPLLTTLTVVVLAGGLGVSIFTFSFLYTTMLKPLPVKEGASIVRLLETGPGASGSIDAAYLARMRPDITTLTDLGVYGQRAVVVGAGERTRSIQVTTTEWNIFGLTGTRPMLGRPLRPDDQASGAEPVIVLSHQTWRAVFGGDSSVVDAFVPLSGVQTRVIGVMPEGYAFPVAAEAWVPIRPEMLTVTEPDRYGLQAYARLKHGVTPERAGAELTDLLRRAQKATPANETPGGGQTGIIVRSYPMAQMGDQGPLAFTVLNTLATLILLLACINVTNLLLARANERARETAVRLALGAPRARLAMQSMWESLLLCLGGGTLATLVADWSLRGVNAWANAHLEGNLAFWWVWKLDRAALLAAGAFITVAMGVIGAVVARRAAGTDIRSVLQEGGSRGDGRREGRIASVLVVTQVATVSVLMFVGSMSAIVAWRVAHLELGYDTQNLLTTSVELPADRYPDAAARGRTYQRMYDVLAAEPAIAAAMLRAPIADIGSEQGEYDHGEGDGPGRRRTFVQAVLGPLTSLGIPLREGRVFDSRDDERSARTAIVSAALAARDWPGASPLGLQIRLAGLGEAESRTVVGVAGDVLLGNPLSRERSPIAVYIPLRQTDLQDAAVTFRHRGNLVAGQAAFHRTLADADPLITPSNVASFDEMIGKTTLIAKGVASLFGACFGFALLLAVSGTWGLMARSIGRRTREIGVRRALGATDRNILVMLLGQGARQLGIGALFALPLTLAVGFGFSRYFPIGAGVSVGTALLVSTVIITVVLFATWFPTRRAMAIEPRDALWRE